MRKSFAGNAGSWLALQLFTVALHGYLCEGVPVSSFYFYGMGAGDTSLGANHNGSGALITLSTDFPYFGTSQTTAYVSFMPA